jgi:hypothetical protein
MGSKPTTVPAADYRLGLRRTRSSQTGKKNMSDPMLAEPQVPIAVARCGTSILVQKFFRRG